jgi:hypothetical protein
LIIDERKIVTTLVPNEEGFIGKFGDNEALTLAVNDQKEIIGSIFLKDRELKISGNFRVPRVQVLSLREFIEPRSVPIPSSFLPGASESLESARMPESVSLMEVANSTTVTPVTIDVLFGYTREALAEVGGSGSRLRLAVNSAINNANLILANSKIVHRFRFSGIYGVFQPQSPSSATNLVRLRTRGDGFWDELHGVRDSLRADLVVLITSSSEFESGSGYLLANGSGGIGPEFGFSYIGFKYLSQSVLSILFGYNLGLNLNEGSAIDLQFSPPYARAWLFSGVSGRRYATIMSGAALFGGPQARIRAPFYSNPSVIFDGVPAGNFERGYNVRHFNENASQVASYRTPLLNTDLRTVQLTPTLSPTSRSDWKLLGMADLDGNHRGGNGSGEMIWYNTKTGIYYSWCMNGSDRNTTHRLPEAPGPSFALKGFGDFNNDRKEDLVWRDRVSGRNIIWLMDGSTTSQVIELPARLDRAWDIENVGDIIGGSSPDIIWRNSVTGSVETWEIVSARFVASYPLGVAPSTSWQVVTTFDFNDDFKSDLLFFNSREKKILVWVMQGGRRLYTKEFATPLGANYEAIETYDYDRNGKRDLILRDVNVSGSTFVHLGSLVQYANKPFLP